MKVRNLIGNQKYEVSFNKLKHLLTTTSILKIGDPYKDFVLCIDACKEGLGGVLIHEKYVVVYQSRKRKEHENNYATHDLELAAIIHALKMWQHYFIGKRFFLMYDNISLEYLFDQHNLNARQARLLSFLSKYSFEIKHIKGKENKVVYTLSHYENVLQTTTSSIYEIDLEDKIKNGEIV